MGNHIRVLTAIILSELLIEWPAYLLGISMAKIISLVIFSTISAAIFHFIFFFLICQIKLDHFKLVRKT